MEESRQVGELQDLRRHRRLELSLPARLSVEKEGRTVVLGNCLTRNISTGGTFLRTSLLTGLGVGSEVFIKFQIPADVCESLAFKNLDARGRIVRVEKPRRGRKDRLGGSRTAGVAVEFNRQLAFSSLLE
jgi:hypothetical protein